MAQLVKNLHAMWETWVGKILWRRERLPTPVFWPRAFHGLYSPWGRKQLDTTERLSLHFSLSLSLFFSSLFIPLFLSPPCLTCPVLLSLYLFLSSRGLHERKYNTWLPTTFNQMCVMFVTMIGNFHKHDCIQQP